MHASRWRKRSQSLAPPAEPPSRRIHPPCPGPPACKWRSKANPWSTPPPPTSKISPKSSTARTMSWASSTPSTARSTAAMYMPRTTCSAACGRCFCNRARPKPSPLAPRPPRPRPPTAPGNPRSKPMAVCPSPGRNHRKRCCSKRPTRIRPATGSTKATSSSDGTVVGQAVLACPNHLRPLRPRPVHVLPRPQIQPDPVAALHKLRHHHLDAVRQFRRLEGAVGLHVHRRRGIGNLDFQHVRKHHAHRPALQELDPHLRPGFQKHRPLAHHRSRNLGLLVGLRIHEAALVGIAVQKFHRPLLQSDLLEPQLRAETVLPKSARIQILEACVRHPSRSYLPGMILRGGHSISLPLVTNGHAGTQLRCRNHFHLRLYRHHEEGS